MPIVRVEYGEQHTSVKAFCKQGYREWDSDRRARGDMSNLRAICWSSFERDPQSIGQAVASSFEAEDGWQLSRAPSWLAPVSTWPLAFLCPHSPQNQHSRRRGTCANTVRLLVIRFPGHIPRFVRPSRGRQYIASKIRMNFNWLYGVISLSYGVHTSWNPG
jgi:hypothetical protein